MIKARITVFLKYRSLLREFVERDIKTRYRRSVLGLFWTLLNPLLTMIVMTIVFSTFFVNNIQNFPVYLLAGLTMYNFFSESTNTAMVSIISGGSLIRQIYVPKYIFPLSKIISCLVNLVASIIVLTLVMLATGLKVKATVLLIFLPVIYIFLFSFGLGLILSTIALFFRDTIHFYGVITLMWMYLTPLFYPLEIIPPAVQRIIMLNPLTNIVEYVRIITLYGAVPPFELNVICLVPGVLAVIIGLWVFFNAQDRFILRI